MKKIKIPISYILSAVIVVSSIIFLAPSTAAKNVSPEESRNVHMHNYYKWYRWAQPDYSYIYIDGSGNYVRAEYINSSVVIETYNKEFKLISKSSVAVEDELFGALYIGDEYNFILTGNLNLDENEDKTVFRITKYDKNWTKLDCAELKGANTTVPFRGGSAKMMEYNGYLYVRTCHEMYKSYDGYNHQANVGIIVDTDTMKLTYRATSVWNLSTGYVSHSFNQFIVADEQTNSVVTLDHGDGYPRSLVICRFDGKLGASTMDYATTVYQTVSFSGPSGYNGTGASVGGFSNTSDGYLQAISYVGDEVELSTDSGYDAEIMRDIYTVFTDRETGETTKNKITDIDFKGSETVSNPFLVDCGNGNYLLMWENRSTSIWEETGTDFNYTSYSCVVNSKGEPISPIIKANAEFSDCQPIVDGDNAYWYVTNGNSISFYSANIETAEIKKEKTIDFNYEEEVTQPEESTVPEESTAPENPQQPVKGDINGDNRVTLIDAKLILKCIAGLTQLDEEQKQAADLDDNGKISIADAKWVLQIVAGTR